MLLGLLAGMKRTLLPALTLSAMFATGCLASEEDPFEPASIDPTGTHYQYVVDSLHFATTAVEATRLGSNIDKDENGRIDNAFGHVLVAISGAAQFDLDEETTTLIDSGQILHLLDVQTTSTDQASGVGVTLLHGKDNDGNPSDNFSGEEVFDVDTAPGSGIMAGFVTGGVVNVELGDVPLAVTFPGLDERFIVNLTHTTINATISEDGLSGRLGGVISRREHDEVIMPFLHAGLSRIVSRDCPDGSSCAVGSFGETLVQAFDYDDDNALSFDELRDSNLLKALLSPDLDLFAENGERCIRCDGVKESLSIGVGFTAVPAVINR